MTGRAPSTGARPRHARGLLRRWRDRHPLLMFMLRRVLVGLALIWLVSLLVFIATAIVPGDPIERILGRYATPENTAALRARLNADGSAVSRYFEWIGGLLRGDLGISVSRSGVTVKELISQRLANSVMLAALAFAFLVPLSIGLGVWAGLRADGRADRVISSLTLTFVAIPDFVVGAILIVTFAVGLELFPPVSLLAPGANPLAHPDILVLPIATVLIVTLALGVRMVRSGMIDVMTSEYVEFARLNGIPERRVVLRHALRNALGPTIQVLALLVQYMIGGLIVIETLFSYPGIGLGLVQAVVDSDFTYVQSVATLLAAIYMVVYIISDIVVVLLVPKLRTRAAP